MGACSSGALANVVLGLFGFGAVAICFWAPLDYRGPLPLWIGLSVVAAILIIVGNGLSTIWKNPEQQADRTVGLIYMSTLIIMTLGRVFG